MTTRHLFRAVALLAGLILSAPTDAQFVFAPSWQPANYPAVRRQVLDWLERASLDPGQAQQARLLWPAVPLRNLEGSELLDMVMETAAMIDPQIARLVADCQAEVSQPYPPDVRWLASSPLPEFIKNNARLYAARWAAQQTLYDEALVLLVEVKVDDVVDPAGFLFYRMIAHHQLVEPELSRAALAQLMEQAGAIPLRYRQVAELVRKDLAGLKDESLDHISRRMNDVRRRLDLGEAGKQVQVVEKGVVDSLDKLIKKLEEQQQQQSSSGAGSAQSSSPMQDSRLPSLKAPGRVDQRDIGNQAGWGNLPPKEREEALQEIGREFPAHYRQLIEQYFRDLANEPTDIPSR